MKKTIRKLVVRSETIRVLEDRCLLHAIGGGALLSESGRTCPIAVNGSGINCLAPAVVATAACG